MIRSSLFLLFSILSTVAVGAQTLEVSIPREACFKHLHRIKALADETFGEGSSEKVRPEEYTELRGCLARAQLEDEGLIFFVASFPDADHARVYWELIEKVLRKKMDEAKQEDPDRKISFVLNEKDLMIRQITPGSIADGNGFLGNMKCRWMDATVACVAAVGLPESGIEVTADSEPYWPHPKWLEYVENL